MQQILNNIINLWKKTYVLLFPQILLITFCLESNLFIHNIILNIILYFPAIYLSNYLLLKLSGFSQNKLNSEHYYYTQALSRLFDTLILFVGLAVVFIALILLTSRLFGVTGAAITALILAIIYSYMIFSYAYVVIKNQKPIQAIQSSFALIHHNIWRITGIFLILGLIQILIFIILFILTGLNISTVIYNLLFTSLNLAVCVRVLEDLK